MFSDKLYMKLSNILINYFWRRVQQLPKEAAIQSAVFPSVVIKTAISKKTLIKVSLLVKTVKITPLENYSLSDNS